DVEANGSDGSIIAHAQTRSDPQRAGEGHRVGADLSGVDESGHAEIADEALAELDRPGVDRGAAGGLSVGKARTHRRISEAAHRRAAAGIEALIGRKLELRRAQNASRQRAEGKDAAARLGYPELREIEIGRGRGEENEEVRAAAGERVGGGDGEGRAARTSSFS